jgi:fermentation-respiration switch protein FrsA (DUF1100 family)
MMITVDWEIVRSQLGFWALRLGRLGLLIYGAVGAYGWFWGDRGLFPSPPSSYTAADLPEAIALPTPDGETLTALHLPSPNAELLILYSHGNGEDLAQIRPHLFRLRNAGERVPVSVFAYDYRGYGTSTGRATAIATTRDLATVYAYVTETLGWPSDRVVLFGRSVGGGPSVALASHTPVGGLILESTFTSAFRTLTRIRLYPFDKFDNLQALPQVTAPILVMHGEQDQVIPFRHGQQLYAAAQDPKVWFPVVDAGHNDLPITAGNAYDRQLESFWQWVADRARSPRP